VWLNRGSSLLAGELCFTMVLTPAHWRDVVYWAGAFSIHSVVMVGARTVLVLRLMGEGRLKLPSPLDTMRNSAVESSIMAHRGVETPLQVERMKAVPSLPFLL
jgi:hypothetical protein